MVEQGIENPCVAGSIPALGTISMRLVMLQTEKAILEKRLVQLRKRHCELDIKAQSIQQEPGIDNLSLHRIKKEKLLLKDEITRIEDQLRPDIIA